MDVPSVLREVDAWPVEDRVLLIQQLWDRLVDQGYEPEIWEDLRDELDRRLAADEAAPDEVVSWEEVKAEALKRTRR
jgi:putative addiction module component (TIGR02574 family)